MLVAGVAIPGAIPVGALHKRRFPDHLDAPVDGLLGERLREGVPSHRSAIAGRPPGNIWIGDMVSILVAVLVAPVALPTVRIVVPFGYLIGDLFMFSPGIAGWELTVAMLSYDQEVHSPIPIFYGEVQGVACFTIQPP